jgi:hypothetical protein
MRFLNWLCQLLGICTRRTAQNEEYKREMAEARVRQEERRENHRQRISRARRLLTGNSWRDPDGKAAFVDEVYEGKVPQYLWYALGDSELFKEDNKAIVATFWGERGPSFGDYELHLSHYSEVGVGLRIRNPKQMAVEIEATGRKCPLYQTGHSDPYGCVSNEPTVLFLGLYEEQ